MKLWFQNMIICENLKLEGSLSLWKIDAEFIVKFNDSEIIWSPIYTDWNVFSQLVAIVEDHYEIHMEFNAELIMDECCTAKDLWEQHVHRYFKIGYDVSICNLDVLNLGGWCLAFERLHTNKLDFNRLNLDLRGLTNKIPIEWLIVATVDRSNLSAKMEFRHFRFSSCNFFRCDCEVLWYLSPTIGGIDSLAWHFTVEFSAAFNRRLWRTLLLHIHCHFIHNWKVNANVRIRKRLACRGLKLEREF